MKITKKISVALILLLTMAVLFSGCGNTQEESSAPEESNAQEESNVPEDSSAPEESAASELGKVIYLTPGTLGDNSFCDSVNSGLQQIAAEYNAETKVIENSFDSSKYSQSVEAAFQWGPDVLFTDAYGMEDLVKQYADQFPDTKVVNLDFELQNDNKTISSVTFIQEEGSFMAGVVAALVTTSDLEYANEDKVVGAMGGQDITVIRSFMDGFEQGVKYVDPEIEVVTNFAGSFSDPAKGKQATKQLYAKGADIVFQIAGVTGNGALEAASEEGKYVIGVDSNQNSLYPGHVVTSMVKDLGGAIYDVYNKMLTGEYTEDTVYEYGLGPNGVYLAIDEYTEAILTEEMLAEITAIQDKVISGEVVVERYVEE